MRELDLTKKLEGRGDTREVIGAIIAEDIELAGEETAADAPKAKTKKAKLERARDEAEMLVKEGDELTEEVYNRLRRQGMDTVKVFARLHDDRPARRDGRDRARRAPGRRVLARRRRRPGDRRSDRRSAARSLNDTLIKKLRKARDQQGAGVRRRRAAPRSHAHQEHAAQGPDPQRGRGAQADLLAAPSGRGAEHGDRARRRSSGCSSSRSATTWAAWAATRSTSGSGSPTPAEPHGADEGRLRRDRPLPRRAARRPRLHGRHRPPRQPPHPLGGRADREPVLGRSLAHGAPGQGAHEHQHRPGEDHARRPGERAHGERGDPGVLRIVAALAVHGPDQPAGRADAQAPALARWARAASRASAPASRCATCTTRSTAACARSRRRKVRTSA